MAQCSASRGLGAGEHREAGYGRPVDRGVWTQKQSNDPGNNQHNPQYANYWAPLTRKRHIPPHPAQPQHTDHWAPRTRKRHRQEHRPQRPTERSDPTQHAKGRTGDCPGPRKETITRRTVTRGLANAVALFRHFAALSAIPPQLPPFPRNSWPLEGTPDRHPRPLRWGREGPRPCGPPCVPRQYHHNVSHHVHCNDHDMDEDVYSAYPVLRLDDRMEPKWYHKYVPGGRRKGPCGGCRGRGLLWGGCCEMGTVPGGCIGTAVHRRRRRGGGTQGCIGRGGGYPPPATLQGAQPLPSHCPPDAKCQPQWCL